MLVCGVSNNKSPFPNARCSTLAIVFGGARTCQCIFSACENVLAPRPTLILLILWLLECRGQIPP
eukprot:6516118-Lingulodinium_polyedra.AAC.1